MLSNILKVLIGALLIMSVGYLINNMSAYAIILLAVLFKIAAFLLMLTVLFVLFQFFRSIHKLSKGEE